MHKPGDIILVPFPFTDLSGTKVRPALLLAGEAKGDDVLVCFITSAAPKSSSGIVGLPVAYAGFKATGLKAASYIRVTKLATLDKRVVLGKLGTLDKKTLGQVRVMLKAYLHI